MNEEKIIRELKKLKEKYIIFYDLSLINKLDKIEKILKDTLEKEYMIANPLYKNLEMIPPSMIVSKIVNENVKEEMNKGACRNINTCCNGNQNNCKSIRYEKSK